MRALKFLDRGYESHNEKKLRSTPARVLLLFYTFTVIRSVTRCPATRSRGLLPLPLLAMVTQPTKRLAGLGEFAMCGKNSHPAGLPCPTCQTVTLQVKFGVARSFLW